LVNRGESNRGESVGSNVVKESADSVKHDLEENEEKRSEEAPGEGEDAI
jgi:hypothetical protein